MLNKKNKRKHNALSKRIARKSKSKQQTNQYTNQENKKMHEFIKPIKSVERERKAEYRKKLTVVQKENIKVNDMMRKRENVQIQTEKEKKLRKESMADYIKLKRLLDAQNSVGENRRKYRIEKGLGLQNGMESTWIRKSLEEMTANERKDYFRVVKQKSRDLQTECKKEKKRNDDRKRKYRQGYAGYRQKRMADLIEDEGTETNSDSDAPYWMDCATDNEGDNDRPNANVIDDNREEEAILLKNIFNEQKKIELKKPAPAIPIRKLCEYEKIRDKNIKERLDAMIQSGLWSKEDVDAIYLKHQLVTKTKTNN